MIEGKAADGVSPRARNLLLLWGPVLLWMAAIFVVSSDNGVTVFEGPPILMALRKSAHIFEYSVLALLLGRALEGTWTRAGERLSRALLLRVWRVGVVIAAVYAVTDEVHQEFVPGRDFNIGDITIDVLSAIAALGIWYIVRLRRRERDTAT